MERISRSKTFTYL
jgi:hypothetical protein